MGILLTAAQELNEKLSLGQKMLADVPENLLNLLIRVVICIVVFIIGSRIIALIRRIVRRALVRSGAAKEVEQFLDSALKGGLYSVLVIAIAVNMGMDAATLATLLGSAGVTIGLAFQGSLKNCIGGVLIMILHPFRVGDYIVEDTHKNEGTVKEITIFYTKLATIDNKTILLPNGALADTSITNVTHEDYRQANLKVGISYETDIRQAKNVILELIRLEERIDKERESMVFVDELGPNSVILGIRFWTSTSDFWPVRWSILEEIKYAFDESGVAIPYPQLDVHINHA